MRVKRRSRHRKVVKFYSTCFGFREPYKVLIDGTFVHHLLVHQLLPADDALRELLSASRAPPLLTSKCVVAELRRLGKSHSEAFDAAQLVATARSLSLLLFHSLIHFSLFHSLTTLNIYLPFYPWPYMH
uniref:PIN domain-containing protein n=1 Tax=Aegilops tauschii subsp. strangulata TaxID=200361 RepID=A0A453JV70_AEGTS